MRNHRSMTVQALRDPRPISAALAFAALIWPAAAAA
jgi:hypothetical protein